MDYGKTHHRNFPRVAARGMFLLPALFIMSGCTQVHRNESLVNFRHLQHLTETVAFAGDSVDIVHIYANYPNYEWVDAKESGPEGISCVDDVGRAAVVYLRHFECTGNRESLQKAKRLLKFVVRMQAGDGEFYNFIFADHSINKDGRTSFKSFGWWAARGVWSMAMGFRIFGIVDPEFALLLRRGVERTFPHIEKLVEMSGRTTMMHGYAVPEWLLYESGSDATSELLLGLIEYYRATGSADVRGMMETLAEGMMVMQDGDAATFPFGLHRSWQTRWHMWGNGQAQALAYAGKILDNKKMIASAEREAMGWYSRLLAGGYLKEMDVADPDKKVGYEQIAYGVRPMVVGLIRLYEATGKSEYVTMAGLAASWFFGNNAPGQRMYDPESGRCFDGLTDSSSVNRNSGAESTIEALHALVELEQFPGALKYLQYRKVGNGETGTYVHAMFEDASANELTLALDMKRSTILLLEGEQSKEFRRNR